MSSRLDELRAKRAALKARTNETLNEMEMLAKESLRLADECHKDRERLVSIDVDKINKKNPGLTQMLANTMW